MILQDILHGDVKTDRCNLTAYMAKPVKSPGTNAGHKPDQSMSPLTIELCKCLFPLYNQADT